VLGNGHVYENDDGIELQFGTTIRTLYTNQDNKQQGNGSIAWIQEAVRESEKVLGAKG
jgi:hypothetical protein